MCMRGAGRLVDVGRGCAENCICCPAPVGRRPRLRSFLAPHVFKPDAAACLTHQPHNQFSPSQTCHAPFHTAGTLDRWEIAAVSMAEPAAAPVERDDDLELALRLHRELNAVPRRQRQPARNQAASAALKTLTKKQQRQQQEEEEESVSSESDAGPSGGAAGGGGEKKGRRRRSSADGGAPPSGEAWGGPALHRAAGRQGCRHAWIASLLAAAPAVNSATQP